MERLPLFAEGGDVEARVRAAGVVGLSYRVAGGVLTLAGDGWEASGDLDAADDRQRLPLFIALSEVEVCGHDLLGQLVRLGKYGFEPGRVFDVRLASQLLAAGVDGTSHDFRDVVARHAPALSDRPGEAICCRALREPMAAAIAADKLTAACDIEMRALPTVAAASANGVGLDVAAWERWVGGETEERRALAAEMNALVRPLRLNWNSTADVRKAFNWLGISAKKTDDQALAAIDHPIAALLRRYRSTTKKAGSYGTGWVQDHVRGGRIHAKWDQLGAATGRMSCGLPNLQSVPKDPAARRCFVPRDGHAFVIADYSQIELRIVAGKACEQAMIDAFARGDDLHVLTAKAITGKQDVTPAERQMAKAVAFGLLYGGGPKMIAAHAKSQFGVGMTVNDAKAHQKAYFAAYPAVAGWHEDYRGQVRERFEKEPGGTSTVRSGSGRLRRIPVAKESAEGAYPNAATFLNFPVQGTGADGYKSALGLMWERRCECPRAVPVIFVHDEIVVECPEAEAEAARVWLVRCMADGMRPFLNGVPVVVEARVARSWAE